MRIRFDNPPINELVIATYFNPPLFSLRSEHIGLLWAKFREEFPVVEQQSPVGGAEVFEAASGEFFPLPRYWFIAEDKINLLQVQKNSFMLNWRRKGEDYPHFFENLKPSYDRYFRIFEDFVRTETSEEEIRIDLCELTYINLIEVSDFWRGPEDTGSVIAGFSVPPVGTELIAPPGFSCTYLYTIESNLQLRVAISNGERTEQEADRESVSALIVEIRAMGRLGQATKSEADIWFDKAHDAIIKCFLSMTRREVQEQYWKPARHVK